MASSVNLDTSERLNITCKRGDSFNLTLTLKNSSGTALPLVTDGYDFLMQVRTLKNSRSTQPSELKIGSASRGRAQEDGLNFTFTADDSGNLTISATPGVMSSVDAGTYEYDLQQEVNGVITTILFGSFKVNDEISVDITIHL